MDKDSLEKIARDPNIIPGIHTYCDRWCQRCPKTSRCTVFAMEEVAGGSQADHTDTDNQAFWNQLQDVFTIMREMVDEWAEKNGIDIHQPLPEEELALREKIDRKTMQHAVTTAAMEYRTAVHEWFTVMNAVIKQKVAQAESAMEMELPGTDPEAELWEFSDIIDIILWYHTLIAVKLRRALQPIVEQQMTGTVDDSGDSDGSAKVALIAMDRSLTAWALLRKHLPEQDAVILDFLVRLERLRRQTEDLFPHARAFVRPGLDEPR